MRLDLFEIIDGVRYYGMILCCARCDGNTEGYEKCRP